MTIVFKLLIIWTFILLQMNCMNGNKNGENWQNPVVVCTLRPNEKPVKNHPSTNTVSEMAFQNFCEKMQKHFKESQISTQEAERIYNLLEESKQIADQQSGMPSPNLPPNRSLNLSELKKRVALKKVSAEVIEVFYYYHGCGTNYNYNRIILNKNEIEKVERIEAWSGVAPC